MDGVGNHKHFCKVCGKSFPCGRSLGGHMRSHLAIAEQKEKQKKRCFQGVESSTGYGLRKNPKKTWRISDVINGGGGCSSLRHKGFPSWKSLFGHMRFHQARSKEEEDDEEEEDGSGSREQEDVALILMMLSKDTSSWSGFNNSSSHGDDYSDRNSSVLIEEQDDEFLVDREMGSTLNRETELGFEDSKRVRSDKRRNRYECRACLKNFSSYQALGGHRARNKKNNGCFALRRGNSSAKEEEEEEAFGFTSLAKKVRGDHHCSTCQRVFTSGQAFRGHKRSHLLNSGDGDGLSPMHPPPANSGRLQETPAMSELLDLNMRVNDDEEHENVEDETSHWWDSGELESEALMAWIS